MDRHLSLLGLAALALAGCPSEQGVKQVDTDPDGTAVGPQLTVTPDELLFDELDVGASQELTFTISNTGDAELQVTDMALYGSTAFTLVSSTTAFSLAPGQSVEYIAAYSPLAPEERAQLHINSNDVGNPDALVDLEGTGRYPQLLISPDPYDFGAVLLGCSRTGVVTLRNTGRATLSISAMAQLGDTFELVTEPPIPLDIPAGGTYDLELRYNPDGEDTTTSQVTITSNDTVATQTADQYGHGVIDPNVVEEFWQGDGPWEKTDIFFYVDQSGSMADDRRNLQANFSTFASRLEDLDMDWQVMVSTKDNGCHNGVIITPDTPSAVEEFTGAVDGRGGSYTESGLTVAENAMEKTTSGECNEGFLREDSKTMLVLVSDEVEQSEPGWNRRVPAILAAAPTASITAIAGDIPSGCATADPGYGYWEASQATHGAFLSICSADWARYFETIANLAATGQLDTFYLDGTPDPVTITVQIDELPVDAADWAYDADRNAIVFVPEALPDPGAHIVVDYVLGGDCEG